MAHHEEPMDIDTDFDDKENSLHHNNVLPFTEKGYEELDVSELNMKLRYSVTPASSPMSKSYPATYFDNRSLDSGDDCLSITVSENTNLTRSLSSTLTKIDNNVRCLKELPLKTISTDSFVDSNRTNSLVRHLEPTAPLDLDSRNVSVTVSPPSDIDDNSSLPSTSSSALHTPEATTPTKEIPPKDSGSPIMRGLKSVLSMFRSSQSPIPLDSEDIVIAQQTLISVEDQISTQDAQLQTVLASTPIAGRQKKETSPTKRSSPQKDNTLVFNEDLETELQWKDETTIIFSQERIPIHKLMLQQLDSKKLTKDATDIPKADKPNLNSTVEYMDISFDSIKDTTVTGTHTDSNQIDNTFTAESDSEFVDCETTFTKNESHLIEDANKTPVGDLTQDLNLTQEMKSNNESGSRLKQIILDTTQDILDATLSVKPEDLLPEILDQAKNSVLALDKHETSGLPTGVDVCLTPVLEKTITQNVDQTFDVTFSNITCQGENFDDSKNDDSILGVTRTEHQLTATDNINTTMVNESILLDNQTYYPDITSVIEHVNRDTNLINIDKSNLTKNDEHTNSLLSSEIETQTRTTISELPVNIPLPDDDDFDKEVVKFVDMRIDLAISPDDVSLDIADDVKLPCESTVVKSSENEINKSGPVVPDIENAPLSISTLPQFNDCNTEKNDVSELDKECQSIYPYIENEINRVQHADVSNEPEAILLKDLNEVSSEYKPLPDIINQTIAFTNTCNIESTSIEYTNEVIVKTPECIDAAQLSVKKESQIASINNPLSVIISHTDKEELPVMPDECINKSELAALPHSFIDNTLTKSVIDPHECNENITIKESNEVAVTNITMKKGGYDEKVDNPNAEEEEIILSSDNSPFTLVGKSPSKLKYETENFKESSTLINKVVITPPISPPITSKGYSFNFDDIDFDPFATKTNIRMSPPFDSPRNPTEIKAKSVERPVPKKDSRRQTQSERKKILTSKRKTNLSLVTIKNDNMVDTACNTFITGPVNNIQIDAPNAIGLNPNQETIDKNIEIEIPAKTEDTAKEFLESGCEILIGDKNEQIISSEYHVLSSENDLIEQKITSSSELSMYCTASDSSIPFKNVFNLPEIGDMKLNPFATKSMLCQSPPQSLHINNVCCASSPGMNSMNSSVTKAENLEERVLEDKINTEVMEKDISSNVSNTTVSPKSTDERNETTREINTEDEDTIEGPFLEVDELNIDDKTSAFDGNDLDMIQFNELPTQTTEENADNGEIFIDAEAFEFLLNQNKSNTVIDSGKESLFLKFDPLFAKRMSAISSDGVVTSLAKLQRNQSTPTKAVQSPSKKIPVAGPSNLNITQDLETNHNEESNDDMNITISKPMMAVPPAVNPITPRNKCTTPNRSNRRSITFTSPAMAVIDRLLSLSGNNSTLYDTTVTQVSREQSEADLALTQLRELLAEKEINVYNLRSETNELRDRLNTLESHVKSLETESQDRLKKINQLNETLAEKTKINRSMAAVVEEYERTIASLIAETAQDKKRHAEERIKLINERDEQTAHLTSMEVSFSDLHSKYEKSKQIILNCKLNEDKYRKSIKEFEENFTKMQNNYELLKQHATSKLNHANQEMEKINRAHEAEVLKLNAMIKRKELHITSLEESLNQKTKANKELTAICDELINKVG